jgi:hypothetical protein
MNISPLTQRSVRWLLVILIAVIAAWRSNVPSSSLAAQERSIPVMIQTVPEMPGARFSLNGIMFTADNHGLALTTVPSPDTYKLSVVSDSMVKGASRLRFARWSDNETQATRSIRVESFTLLHAGFEATRRVAFEFVDPDGGAIDPERVESISITNGEGKTTTLTGPGPHRLLATTIRQDRASLVLERISYKVNNVIVDGREVPGGAIKVTPAVSSEPTIELTLPESAAPAGGSDSSLEENAGPPSREESDSLVPSSVVIAILIAMGLGAALVAAKRLHLASATRAVVMRLRSWSPWTALARINPFPRIASRLRRIDVGPRIAAGIRRLNPRPAISAIGAGLRRLNPAPALAAGIKKLNPRPAISAIGAGLRRLNPAPAVAAGMSRLNLRERARALRKLNPAPKVVAGLRSLRPTTQLTNLRRLNPAPKVSATIRKRRLKAQLRALHKQGPRPKIKKPHEPRRKPLVTMKGNGGGGISLLWLRGSRPRGPLREYGLGPKVRIKLRNGHIVIGTIRRTPTHVDQSAVNIFVEKTFDASGREVPNLPEDSFILPSQILSIEKWNDHDNKVIRLPEPHDHGAGRRRGPRPDGDRKKADGR